MPIPPGIIAASLGLLPKLPELWKDVADLFKKDVPKNLEDAGKLAGDIIDAFQQGQVPVEQEIKLKALFFTHEERIRALDLKEKELGYTHEQKRWATYAQLEAQDAASINNFRAETRPKILRDLFKTVALYTIIAPLATLLCTILATELVPTFIDMVKWIGTALYGTFSAGFLGYSIVRSGWDKKGQPRPDNAMVNSLSKLV